VKEKRPLQKKLSKENTLGCCKLNDEVFVDGVPIFIKIFKYFMQM